MRRVYAHGFQRRVYFSDTNQVNRQKIALFFTGRFDRFTSTPCKQPWSCAWHIEGPRGSYNKRSATLHIYTRQSTARRGSTPNSCPLPRLTLYNQTIRYCTESRIRICLLIHVPPKTAWRFSFSSDPPSHVLKPRNNEPYVLNALPTFLAQGKQNHLPSVGETDRENDIFGTSSRPVRVAPSHVRKPRSRRYLLDTGPLLHERAVVVRCVYASTNFKETTYSCTTDVKHLEVLLYNKSMVVCCGASDLGRFEPPRALLLDMTHKHTHTHTHRACHNVHFS